MKIAVFEKTNFNDEQKRRLEAIGTVDYFDGLSQDEANQLAPKYDVVVVNWLDPTEFLMNMNEGSLVALLSTGYGWITNIKDAHNKGIYVANIPNYSTEAVSEHLLGLLFGVSKNIFLTLNKEDNGNMGFELKGKTVGIIGLGNIGGRFAEILNFFGVNILTYNRNIKNIDNVKDVSLNELLESSDIICISCAVNEDSRNLINMNNIVKIKKGAVIIGCTWNIIEESALIYALQNELVNSISFDAAVEGGSSINQALSTFGKRVFLTPHIAYNTFESEENQINILIDNILNFSVGNPKNIVF